MISSVQSGSRSAPGTTSTEKRPDEVLRFAEYVTKLCNYNRDVATQREAKKAPSLLYLTAAVCGARIPLNRPSDFAAAQKFLDSIGIASVKHAICRSLTPPDPKLLVQIGVPCDKVAEKYRIPPLMYAMKELVTIAIDEGMEDLRNGKSCIEIAEKRGIPQDRLTMYELHLRAVKGPLAELVRNGEPCDKVAEKYGIPQDSITINVLQKITIDEGPAGKCVGNGEPCDKVAEKYGLPLDGIGRGVLEVRAARGVAGERVRKGESPFTVSDEHGIRRDSKAMEMLKMISVETRF
ncbi:hypothetical protein LGM46_33460 [Burkholderia arboris]|uniref:Uncharacterized protein n=1 Tax=Burkholderia metallica TaxID=488729 RepID=A0ABT8PER3_9BURK|nr:MULTISPECIES: hypothetical protein [Burkholderia cepacia complex]MCA8037881.1 hypothetical protein [Burkholderia arboris]MDN7933626.1 hypothetical protein [Burkholderia metallica]